MWVVFVVAAAVVLFAVAAVAVGRGDGMPEAPPDREPTDVPHVPLTAADLARTRFGVGLRGYRMDEVDELLERVQAELTRRDERINRLESALGGRAAGPGGARPGEDREPPGASRSAPGDAEAAP
ncbi:MAG TPA: DivIVA domain-containing protein [Jiangellales bacterium]|nr:DivIVA domain-containing protein [Jiangellales bacterium]